MTNTDDRKLDGEECSISKCSRDRIVIVRPVQVNDIDVVKACDTTHSDIVDAEGSIVDSVWRKHVVRLSVNARRVKHTWVIAHVDLKTRDSIG